MNASLEMRARTLAPDIEMTPCQRRVWDAVGRDGCAGLRFRRQEVLGQYIADFYCPALRVALEIDGAASDTARDLALKEHSGLRILHLRSEMVLSSTLEEIRAAILNQLWHRQTL